MRAGKMILNVRVEDSELIDYSKSLSLSLKEKFPNVDVHEIDNFSSNMLVQVTVDELKKSEQVILIFDINTAKADKVMPVFQVANMLIKTKTETRSFYLGEHERLKVLFNKLKTKQVHSKDELFAEMEEVISV